MGLKKDNFVEMFFKLIKSEADEQKWKPFFAAPAAQAKRILTGFLPTTVLFENSKPEYLRTQNFTLPGGDAIEKGERVIKVLVKKRQSQDSTGPLRPVWLAH